MFGLGFASLATSGCARPKPSIPRRIRALTRLASRKGRQIMNNQRLVILLLLVAYIFSPSLFNWIINPEGAWYRPYIVWVVVIVIAFIMQLRHKKSHDFD